MKKVYLLITIDTEEDQWNATQAPPTLQNIQCLPKLQALFDEHEVLPTYLVTYPVADDREASHILSGLMETGKCEIGAHLHPWNTPPIKEALCKENTMLCNLPYDLQLEKLQQLTDKITTRFGVRPRVFRAGRWGLGPLTVRALLHCGYTVDTSVTPFISWRSYGGPSFMGASFKPHFVDMAGNVDLQSKASGILEIPASIGYNRWPFDKWRHFDVFLKKRWLAVLHARGIAYRLNLFRRIWLSPELQTTKEMLQVTKAFLAQGATVLNMSFHSVSLMPGLNSFVRDHRDLSRFYTNIETYLTEVRKVVELVPIGLSATYELALRGEI